MFFDVVTTCSQKAPRNVHVIIFFPSLILENTLIKNKPPTRVPENTNNNFFKIEISLRGIFISIKELAAITNIAPI
jgi:hypothetical protein